MRGIGRLFDERDTLVRLVLLDVSGLSYLVLQPTEGPAPTPWQWVLAVAAFVATLVLYRRPVPNLVVQTVLLVVAVATLADPLINQVGAGWALLEVTMLVQRPRIWWPMLVLHSGIHVVDEVAGNEHGLAGGLLGLGLRVGLPVLLGLNVRGARILTRQAEEHAADEQRRRESENRAARAEERSAIARELHDVVAHHVASMVLRVGVARYVLTDTDPRAAEVFDDVHATGTAALTELRGLVALLRDPDGVRADSAATAIEPAALPAALLAVADRAQRAGLTVDADVSPRVAELDAVRGLAVLRLTQEALTNVAKHAGPSAHATVSVTVHDGDVHFSVEDDGRPDGAAKPPGAAPPGGHGLTGMRERVDVLGGRLQAGPAGRGWRVSTVLPAPVTADAQVGERAP